jgi:hypothetical protein
MFSLVAIAFWIITTIVHIALAVGVYFDTGLLWRHERRKTIFAGGPIWALAALVGGPIVAAIYWLIHHSSLRPQAASGTAPQDR